LSYNWRKPIVYGHRRIGHDVMTRRHKNNIQAWVMNELQVFCHWLFPNQSTDYEDKFIDLHLRAGIELSAKCDHFITVQPIFMNKVSM
jgi:hypothetical protein